MQRITAASPKEQYNLVDFYFLSDAVSELLVANYIERLDAFYTFEFNLHLAGEKESEHGDEMHRLSVYLYTETTDALSIVGKEYGLDVEGYRKKMSDVFFIGGQMEDSDSINVRRLEPGHPVPSARREAI